MSSKSGDTHTQIKDEIVSTALAIIKVEGEIEAVEKQIQRVENKLEENLSPDDTQYWRRKEEQLRREEEQLRRKEEQLRRKEELLRTEEEQLRRKKEFLHAEPIANFGRRPLLVHPQQQSEIDDFRIQLQELKETVRTLRKENRATPQKTAASLGREERMRLQRCNMFDQYDDDDEKGGSARGGPSVLSDAEQQKLEESCTTEHQVVAFLTPFLERVFEGHPSGLVVVNSEQYKWLETSSTDDSSIYCYNQKPDLILCHPAYCRSRKPLDTSDEKLLQLRSLGGSQHRFGILAKWSLRNSIGLTGDAKLSIDDKAFGEAINYGSHICHRRHLNDQEHPIHTRLILFDKKEFWLIDCIKGTVSNVKRCGWTAAGSYALLQNFPLVDSWTTVLQAALAHFSVSIDDEEDPFLGAGAFGRVFRVRGNQGCVFALKVVKDEGDNAIELEQEKFNMRKAKKECPDLVMGIEGFAWFDEKGGGALLLSQVGQHYSEIKQIKWMRIRDSLEELHRNDIIHGDARVENVVAVDGKPCWINFRTVLFSNNTAAKKRDWKTLMDSIRAAEADGW